MEFWIVLQSIFLKSNGLKFGNMSRLYIFAHYIINYHLKSIFQLDFRDNFIEV